MSNKDNPQSSSPSNEKPPEPTAADVAKVCGKLVETLQPLPAALQLRALQSTATMLGLDKEQRGRSNSNAQQQRTSNANQNRSGGTR